MAERKSINFPELTTFALTDNCFTGDPANGQWKRSTVGQFFSRLGMAVTIDGVTTGFTGNISAVGGTFSGNVGAVDGVFSGNIGGVVGTFSGNIGAVDGVFSGNVAAVGGTFTGEILGNRAVADQTVLRAQIAGAETGTINVGATALIFQGFTGKELWFGANNLNTHFRIATTGIATFTADVTSTNFILSSDARLKENSRELGGGFIAYNMKGDKQKRVGVMAQVIEKTNPEFVRTDEKGMKSVAYIDMLCFKMAEMHKDIELLKIK